MISGRTTIPLTATELLFSATLLIIAYLVRGITGFGSGLIIIPTLALLLPVTTVVPMVGLLDFAASLSHGVKHHRQILWRELLPLLPFSMFGVASALYLFHTLNPELLSRLLGGFVLGYALYTLFGKASSNIVSRWWSIPGGFFAGSVGTLFGTGGPFYVTYLQLRGIDKSHFRATIALIFLLDGCSRITGYTLTGVYTEETILLTLSAMPLMFIALYLGGRIHTTITQAQFRKGISILLTISGITLILH
ncbi:MAG: sulfite exporter TauE/SafE family protein [Gammaproteobacteria bacterium]|nr:sulfite exporter TauE/SafE family protein [Gammaproteobacteria bacterium]